MKTLYPLSLLLILALASGTARATEVPFADELWIEAGFNHAYSVVSADLDGDGDLDLFASAESGDALAWFENTGNGATWPRHDVVPTQDPPLFDRPRSVAAGETRWARPTSMATATSTCSGARRAPSPGGSWVGPRSLRATPRPGRSD